MVVVVVVVAAAVAIFKVLSYYSPRETTYINELTN
jgi:hypothetical protein